MSYFMQHDHITLGVTMGVKYKRITSNYQKFDLKNFFWERILTHNSLPCLQNMLQEYTTSVKDTENTFAIISSNIVLTQMKYYIRVCIKATIRNGRNVIIISDPHFNEELC